MTYPGVAWHSALGQSTPASVSMLSSVFPFPVPIETAALYRHRRTNRAAHSLACRASALAVPHRLAHMMPKDVKGCFGFGLCGLGEGVRVRLGEVVEDATLKLLHRHLVLAAPPVVQSMPRPLQPLRPLQHPPAAPCSAHTWSRAEG